MRRRREGLLSRLLRRAPAAMVVCDGEGLVSFATPYARRVLGEDPRARHLGPLLSDDSRPGLSARIAEVLAAGDPERSVHGELTTASDPPRMLEYEARLADDRPGGDQVVLVLHDVTRHHERAEALKRQVRTDPLTGLANHAGHHERLRQLSRADAPAWIALLDLDHFKQVNDRFGHAAGDRVLVEAARRIGDATGTEPQAFAARIGGEEFAILLPEASEAHAVSLIGSVLARLAERHEEVGVVTASAGLALIPRAGTAGSRAAAAAQAHARADEALYLAKSAGRGRLLVHGEQTAAARRRAAETIEGLRRQNAELARTALTDALTGVGNRHRFDRDLPALAGACSRRGAHFAVAFLDLDEFGLVNKRWEDEAGDRTLTEAAAAMSAALRSGDALYRYGGEEFVAILGDADRDGGLRACKRLRRALAERRIAHPTRGRLTASIGVACSADHDGDPGAVVSAAISAMRRAKADGRNRVVTDWAVAGR